MKMRLHLILDDGHGWSTPGKRSPDGSLRENDFNSAVVNMLVALIHSGYDGRITYTLTAPTHVDVPLLERRRIRDDTVARMAEQDIPCLFFSIHADAFRLSSANGTTTFYDDAGPSKTLAAITQECLVKRLVRRDRGIKHARFSVIKYPTCPSVLIESMFMTNPTEEDLLEEPFTRYRTALAILDTAEIWYECEYLPIV